jgi:adenine C2-methylase RlmN of 23S rRNA A2503 and tRNA A37
VTTTSPYLPAPEELASLLPGEPRFRADQLQEWLYRSPVLSVDDMTNLPESNSWIIRSIA